MKEEIIRLHSEGKSYREIESLLGCSKGTISYHIAPQTKRRHRANQVKRRNGKKELAVQLKGGKCVCCGYNKCIAALELHHLDPRTKEYSSSGWRCLSKERMLEEIKKCVLLCANCHREIHAGIRKLEPSQELES
jgi:transposase